MYQDEVRELLREKSDLRDRYDHWIVDMNADPNRKTCPRCCKVTDVDLLQLQDRHVTKFGLLVSAVGHIVKISLEHKRVLIYLISVKSAI